MIVNLEEIAILLATRTEACVKGSTLVGAAGAFQETMELTTRSLADCLGCKTRGTQKDVEGRIILADTGRYFWQAMYLQQGLAATLSNVMPEVITIPELRYQAGSAMANAALSFVVWPWDKGDAEKWAKGDVGRFLNSLMLTNWDAYAEIEAPVEWGARHHRRALLEVGRRVREENLYVYSCLALADHLLAIGDVETVDWMVKNSKLESVSWIMHNLGYLSFRHDVERMAMLMLTRGANNPAIKPYVTMEIEKRYLELYAERFEKVKAKRERRVDIQNDLKVVFANIRNDTPTIPTLSSLDYVYHWIMGGQWDAAAMSHPMATPMTLVNARIDSHIDEATYVLLMRACFGVDNPDRIYAATQGRGYYDGRTNVPRLNTFFGNPRTCSTVAIWSISGRDNYWNRQRHLALSHDFDGDMPIVQRRAIANNGNVLADWGTIEQPAPRVRLAVPPEPTVAPRFEVRHNGPATVRLPLIVTRANASELGETDNNIQAMREAQQASIGDILRELETPTIPL